MGKTLGIIGGKGKYVVSTMIDLVLKDAGYTSTVISSEDIKAKIIKHKSNIEKTGDRNILIITISKEDIKTIIDLNVELNIIVDASMALDGNREDKFWNDKIKLVKRLNKNNLLIINTDDEYSTKLAYENQKAIVMTYGLNGRSSLTASSLDLDSNIKFHLCLQRSVETFCNSYVDPFEYPIEVNLTGMDNLYSTFAAISLALHFNIDLETIIKTLSMLDINKIKID